MVRKNARLHNLYYSVMNDITEKDMKIIATVSIITYIVCLVGFTILPVFAANDFATSYSSVMDNLFKIISSLFASTACVVILVSLFLILIGTGDQDVQKGIHKIKICIACVIGSFLVTILVSTITSAMGNAGGGTPSSVK